MFFNILGNGYNIGYMVHSSVHPIKCFYILGNCYMVHSSVHSIKCFYILGNCYNICYIGLSAYYQTALFPKLLPTFLYEKLSSEDELRRC